MEKKKYIKPEITVIEIDGDCQILAGSDTIENGKNLTPVWGDEYVD